MREKYPPTQTPSILNLIKADIDRYCYNPDYASFNLAIEGHYCKKFMNLFFRHKNNCFRNLFYFRIGRLSKLLCWLFKPPYNTTIICSKNVEGGAIYFSHAYGTILNCEHIGYGCAFLQNTTFGNKNKNGKYVRPYLGNNVIVGANVVVIGDVHIGNNVKIGAGAVVTKSIPDNCVVVGNPARIIIQDGIKVNKPL